MLPEIKKILYATDMSETSLLAFRYALSLAKRYGAKISVIHVLPNIPKYVESQITPFVTKEKMIETSLELLRQQVHNFCEEVTCKLPGTEDVIEGIWIRQGVPDQVILAEAKEGQADLIVMGQHGHSVVTDALFMGGTARRVVHHSKLPVLLVRLPNY